MRVVFDTNIFIAVALQGTFSENLLTLPKTKIITLICSEEILNELQQKLQAKFRWKETDAYSFSQQIREIAEIIEPEEAISVLTRDPDDNKILTCALSGHADLIVTADQDLIQLKEFKGIAIVHPKTLSYTFPTYFKKTTKP